METVRLAVEKDISILQKLYTACTNHLLSQQIFQWDVSYPTISHISYHVKAGEMYVSLSEDGAVNGAVVVNTWEAPEWETVNWQGINPLVIHMLCVDPLSQNGGVGKRLLSFVETIARENDNSSIRLDSYAKNDKSLAFYKKAGFHEVGSVRFSGKEPGCDQYICFEKEI